MHTTPVRPIDAAGPRSVGSPVRFLLRAAVSMLRVAAVTEPAAAQAAPTRLQPASELVEPGAGAWTTWLLTSGSELRLPPPPDETASKAELIKVLDLALERDRGELDRISYWDASAPSYCWTQRSVKHTLARGVLGNRVIRRMAHPPAATPSVRKWVFFRNEHIQRGRSHETA